MTIFFSITHGFQARDLLRTDVFKTVRGGGATIVILTPNHDDEYFRREFAGPGIFIEPLVMQTGQLENAMAAFRRYVLANFRLNRTIHALNERFHRSRRPRYVAVRALNAVFGRVRFARRAWMRLEALLFPGRHYDPLFSRYAPSLVVTGTPGSIAADAHLLRAARRVRVRTACVVLSWDNLTSKGHMAAVPDDLIVWNDIMKREAIEFHDYPASRVHVTGVSHFDVYASPVEPGARDQFFRQLGLDPSRKLITFGTVTPWLFPYNGDIAEILARASAEGRFRFPVQIVVRVHPQVISAGTAHTENLERFREIARKYPHVHLDVPAVKSASLMWDVAERDMRHLASLMRFSDVTLNAGSTLTIDSAIVDTPIVNIGFDGYGHPDPADSVLRIYGFTHYANLVRTGGLRVATSETDLIERLNAYLENPALDREARAQLVKEQCFRVDGKSGQRVGAALLGMTGAIVANSRYSTMPAQDAETGSAVAATRG